MCLFQSMSSHDDTAKTTIVSIDTHMNNMLGTKHSLCGTVDQHLSNGDPSALKNHLTSVLLDQMTTEAGIKKHGDKAREALFTEFSHLHEINVLIPIEMKDLTREKIKGTLRSMSVIKEKYHDALKERSCAVGAPKQELNSKHETASPTAHADSFMLETSIEAKERRQVGTRDVSRAFLHASQKDFTVIKFVNE